MIKKQCPGMPLQKGLIWLLLLLPAAVCSYAQQGAAVVSGIIKSENGEALQGAVVKVENKSAAYSASTTSNAKGFFSFAALPAGGPYSFIIHSVGFLADTLNGYVAKENGRISLSVVLQTKSQNLDNIVVVGYGRSSKATITGAVTSVQSEDFNKGVFNNPMQLMQGKVAGLNITKSGNPNESPGVILRGPSSFRNGAQEPFYVIDGVPGASLFLVAPDDIVSIDVLKDASSTAIYGSRAANGVIMITTRKARPGQSKLSVNNSVAFENISNTIEMATGDQLREFVTRELVPLAKPFKPDATNVDQTRYNANDGANTNWQKEVTRTGVSHNHNITFNGAGEHSEYGASVNYLKNQGIIRSSSLERLIFRANIVHRAFDDRLHLNLNVANSNSTGRLVPDQIYNNMLTYLPVTSVRNENGSFKEDVTRTIGAMGYYNPVSLVENNDIETKNRLFLVNGNVKVNILKGLDFNTMLSIQSEQVDKNIYYNAQSMLAPGLNGAAERTTLTNTKKILESFFNYDKSFGPHNMKLLAGYSWQEDRLNDGFGASNQGFSNDELSWNGIGLGDNTRPVNYGSIFIKTQRIISFYGRANYDFKGKYVFQASLRRDGSSAFGVNNRWGMFPAVSAGWNISKESFMKNIAFVNQLKLRAGYGVSGNSAGFDPNISMLIYRSGSQEKFYYNGRFINAIRTTQNENLNLAWERTGMVNLGIDFSLFKNFITGSLDVYNKQTSDLIVTYGVSPTMFVYDSLSANVGKMNNKGIELALAAHIVRKKDFSFTTEINLARNINEVVAVSNTATAVNEIYTANNLVARNQSAINGYQVIKGGLPLGTFYTMRYAGKAADGKTQFYKKDGTLTGTSVFNEFQENGSAQPALLYGWNNSFRYKNIDLNFFVRGVAGNKILNATRAYISNPYEANIANIPVETLQEKGADIQNSTVSDRYIENGSYLRLDNATIGYTVKTKKDYSFRLYVSSNNILVITDYKGMDPEINMAGQTPGIDNSNFYPKTRSVLVGLNMIF